MSQDDRSSQTLQDTAVQTVSESTPTAISPWEGFPEPGELAVQSYADRLMDDLFTEMEESLERGSTLSNETVQPEPPIASTNQLQQMVLAAFQQRRQAEVAQLDDARSGVSDLVAAAAVSPAPPPKPPSPAPFSFDRFLLVMGGVAITATGILWVVTRSFNPTTPVAQAPAPQTSSPENAFGDYVKQSLQAIAAKSPFPSSSGPNPTPNGTIPAVTVSPGPSSPATSPSPQRPAIGLSRMVPPAPLPQVPTGPQTAPAAPGFMASGTPLPPAGGMANAGVVRSLVGVMQLGDRSAALIETNGIAQRIRVGESIGSSGWTLVDVSKDQAVIRRNGEVRSIFIGQTF